MKSSIYLYTMDMCLNDFNLPSVILKHCNSYNLEEKRKISLSNYSYLAKKLNDLGIDINTLSFTDLNKPILPNLNISMSHSKELFGFIISDSSCGIDIEELILPRHYNLSKRILNAKEYAEFLKSDDKSLYLTKKWCLKEAYSKKIGTGLAKEIYEKEIDGICFRIDKSIIAYLNSKNNANIYLNDRIYKVDE